MSENKDLIKLKIDGQEVEVPKGTTVLKAAEKVGKSIPHFCYHDGLPIVGQCRMCYVEIEGMPKLATSCSTVANEGMEVKTDSEKVKKGQNATLEFVLLDHPLDCPICDRGGECKLQDYTYEHGPSRSRMIDQKEELIKHKPVSEQIVLDQERCILCTRCVRFSDHVDGRTELVVNERGSHSVINVFDERPMESKFSGNVVDICPVGALTAKDYRFKARPWELRKHEGICSGCSVGCNIEIHTKHRHPGIARPDGSQPKPLVERLVPRENTKVNDWWMCDKGRWGYHYHNAEDKRIHEPKIRRKAGEAHSSSSFKEVQLMIEKAIGKNKGPWTFLSTNTVSHEQIEWTQQLKKSWEDRGRQSSSDINNSALGAKVLEFYKKQASNSYISGEATLDGIKTVVSTCESYRELEDIVPILALKLGQKVREEGVKWESRKAGDFFKTEDESASTLYLLPEICSEEDLQAAEKAPTDAKLIVLWEELNTRGLINEGIAPLHLAAKELQENKAPLFISAQKLKGDYPQALLDAAKAAPFVVLVDAFESPLSEFADVILPVEAFYDSRCSATNLFNMKQLSKGISVKHPSFESVNRGSESPISATLNLL